MTSSTTLDQLAQEDQRRWAERQGAKRQRAWRRGMATALLALAPTLTACGDWSETPANDVPVVDNGGQVEFDIDLDSKRKTVTVQAPKPVAPAPRPPAPRPAPPAPKSGK